MKLGTKKKKTGQKERIWEGEGKSLSVPWTDVSRSPAGFVCLKEGRPQNNSFYTSSTEVH